MSHTSIFLLLGSSWQALPFLRWRALLFSRFFFFGVLWWLWSLPFVIATLPPLIVCLSYFNSASCMTMYKYAIACYTRRSAFLRTKNWAASLLYFDPTIWRCRYIQRVFPVQTWKVHLLLDDDQKNGLSWFVPLFFFLWA